MCAACGKRLGASFAGIGRRVARRKRATTYGERSHRRMGGDRIFKGGAGKIPVNRCAVAGIILSFAALLALVSMFFVVWFVMAQNPEWFEDDYILTSGDLLRFTMSFVVPLALAFLFSAAGCAVSVVGFCAANASVYRVWPSGDSSSGLLSL